MTISRDLAGKIADRSGGKPVRPHTERIRPFDLRADRPSHSKTAATSALRAATDALRHSVKPAPGLPRPRADPFPSPARMVEAGHPDETGMSRTMHGGEQLFLNGWEKAMHRPTARERIQAARHSRLLRVLTGVTVASSPNRWNHGCRDASSEPMLPSSPESDDSATHRDRDRHETRSMCGTTACSSKWAYLTGDKSWRQTEWLDGSTVGGQRQVALGCIQEAATHSRWGESLVDRCRGRYRRCSCSLRWRSAGRRDHRFNSSNAGRRCWRPIRIDRPAAACSRAAAAPTNTTMLASPCSSPGWTSPRPQICMTVRR